MEKVEKVEERIRKKWKENGKKVKVERKLWKNVGKIGENSFLPCKEHVLAVQQSWTSSGLLTMMNP